MFVRSLIQKIKLDDIKIRERDGKLKRLNECSLSWPLNYRCSRRHGLSAPSTNSNAKCLTSDFVSVKNMIMRCRWRDKPKGRNKNELKLKFNIWIIERKFPAREEISQRMRRTLERCYLFIKYVKLQIWCFANCRLWIAKGIDQGIVLKLCLIKLFVTSYSTYEQDPNLFYFVTTQQIPRTVRHN